MKDNEIIDLLASRLESAAGAGAWKDSEGNYYGVSQKQQPTQQGIPYVPQIFFEKLFDIPWGWPIVKYYFDESTGVYSEIETQLTETHFQISALVIQNPFDLTIPTPSDVVNFVRAFMVSKQTLRLFKTNNVSVLRVSEVRNPYFEDDRHRNEATPSFDFVLTHDRFITNQSEYAEEAISNGIFPI